LQAARISCQLGDAVATEVDETLAAAASGDERAFGRLVAPFRSELNAHCYRMSGSLHDAEELLQDSLLRAWKGLGAFEGRSSVRTWLYKIATNTCLNALASKKARGLPADFRGAGEPSDPMEPQLEPVWLEPCPAALYADAVRSPEALYDGRQSVALAFMAALQLLPATQRAVLVLHDVIGFGAAECAELLEMTAAAVNSALQRARATLEARREAWQPAPDSKLRPWLERYVRAWESADLPALVSLLHEDATLAMPPIPIWLRGAKALESSMHAMVFASAAPGEFQIVETEANGVPALAIYRGGQAFALQIVEWREGRIAAITAFLDVSLFGLFGLTDLRI
jgi:RNA polymerase sigma-70 factor (ECF subfamily)